MKTTQPVIQLDYAFLGDNSENPQVTLVTAIDLLSGVGLSCVVPSKGRSVYAQAELRRFVRETGRAFGILQIDPEPSLKALVAEITSEVGGLSVRHSPTGFDLEARYPGFDLSITHPLFSWLVKHAQWLLNRYAQKSDGLTPFEKRWGKPYSGSLCRFAEVVHFRKVGKFPKAVPACEEGLWLGRDTESNQHFVATPHGVFKTRSLRRRPPSEQIHKALLESLKATPWDPKGSREETDNFVFPSVGPGATSQGVKPLERPDTAELPEDQPHGEEEIFRDAMEHFHEMVRESETRTSADVPVQDDMNIEELAEGLLKRASELASGATSSAEPPTSRPRVGPPPSVERKRETSDVPEATTKVQRISSLFRTSDHPMNVFDFRVSAVTTKQELDVPVAVNQDEAEMTLEERFKNPLFGSLLSSLRKRRCFW